MFFKKSIQVAYLHDLAFENPLFPGSPSLQNNKESILHKSRLDVLFFKNECANISAIVTSILITQFSS